jgi:hypothetical protein
MRVGDRCVTTFEVWSGDEDAVIVCECDSEADAALIVALSNAYAAGTLRTKEEWIASGELVDAIEAAQRTCPPHSSTAPSHA